MSCVAFDASIREAQAIAVSTESPALYWFVNLFFWVGQRFLNRFK